MQALDLSMIKLFLTDEDCSEFDYSFFCSFAFNPTIAEEENHRRFFFC